MLSHSAVTPGRLSPSSRWQSRRMSAVNTTSLLTVLQEVNLHQAAERFPDQVCCPLTVRHSLILLVWAQICSNFEWLQTISSHKIQVPKNSKGEKKRIWVNQLSSEKEEQILNDKIPTMTMRSQFTTARWCYKNKPLSSQKNGLTTSFLLLFSQY